MKILHICAYTWDMGGPPKVIYDNAAIQVANGAEVTILTPISEGQKLYPAPDGVNVVACKRHKLARFWTEFSPELYTWLKNNGDTFDILHLHGIWHFGSVAPFLLGLKASKCITIHGLLRPWAYRNGYWKKLIFKWLFQKKALLNAEMIHVYSKEEYHDVMEFLGESHPNVVIIPNGIEIEPFENLTSKTYFQTSLGFPKNKKIILFLGRIDFTKGLDLLLPAIQKLSSERSDFILVLAGPDSGYLDFTNTFIKQNRAEDYIKWIGMKTGSEKLEAFAGADIFVLPSHTEAFSIAALEGLMSGTPSVFSDKVGFAEEIIETESAIIVDLDVDSIKNAINRLLSDEEEGKRIAKNGQHLVRTQYDIRVVGKRIMNEFVKIMK
jgi:glycosyltransferase involved in cell wall biosynthesis